MAYDGTLKFDTHVDSSGFQSGVSKLAGLAKTGMATAAAAVGAVSTALVTAGGYAVKVGSDFEAGMSKVQAISGATQDELEQLTTKAKEMGAKTKFSAAESAEAFQYMAMAGWKTGDMLNGIEGIMNLAAASGEELAGVSDIVTDALTAFGLQAKDSAHFADVLAAASSNSNTNVSMMGYTFKYVAPIAGSLKYSIEDVATAVGLMANAGIKGEQAGTSLRSMLTRMINPPKDAAAAMEALNLSMTNADGTMRPLNDVLLDMRESFSKLDDSQKASYASSLAGQEAMSGLLAIVNASDEDFEKLSAAINNADGTAQEMAQTMQDNLQGAVEEFTGSVETLGLEVYEGMQEPLKEAVTEGIEYVNRLTETFRTGGLEEAVAETGEIFGELAVKAAEQAPKMVNASVKFIQSFVNGIAKNSSKLLSAAKSIVSALVNGLVKLLPKEVQKPVQETVNILKKSFEDGGLKSAINTTSNILKNLGTIATNLARTILPPLAKAVDFVGENLDILLPIVSSVTAAFAAQAIVSQITSMMAAHKAIVELLTKAEQANALQLLAANGALSIKEMLVGVLTGKITLATAAQWLWNAAMNANPIGLIVTAVAALTAGITALCLVTNDGTSAEERLAESTAALGESFVKVAEGAAEFYEGIQNAESHLSAFNDTLFASAEEQQELQTNMEEVQNGITSICKLATEERRDYTEAEIQQLDEYFQKLADLTQQQFDLEQQKAESIRQVAETEAETHRGSLAEYEAVSQEWINTAQEQYEAQKQLAEESAINEIALLNQKYGDQATMSNEAYAKEYEAILARKEQNITAAQEEVGAVVSAFEEGYVERSQNLQDFLEKTREYQEQEQAEQDQHNEKMAQLSQELQDIENDETLFLNDKNYAIGNIQQSMQNETRRHNEKLKDMQDEYHKELDEGTQEELSNWLTMLAQTEQYGGKISKENKDMVDDILDELDGLSPKTREAMKNAMSPMLEEMENSEPGLFEKAAGIANGILSRLKSVFGIKSPSRETRKIFRQVMEGAEGGLQDEVPKLLKQTDSIAQNVIQGFQKARFNASALVQRMKSAVSSQMKLVSAPAVASAAQTTAGLAYAYAGESSQPGMLHRIEIPLQLDGREVARATAEYTDDELEEIRRRKERGG